MKFLVDAQLPPALARYLNQTGHEAEHVAHIGMEKSDDNSIWDYAISNGMAIVTKDEGFAARIQIW